jgi:hypothetical protein
LPRLALLIALTGCGRIGFSATHDASPAGDASDSGIDGDDASAACVRIGLSDNFDDNATAATWMTVANNPVTTTETGGALVVQLANNVGGGRYGGYQSLATFDLRDHCMVITFTTVPASLPSTEMDFLALTPNGTIGFAVSNGVLNASYNPGVFQAFRTAPYDPAAHHVLLLREDSGTMSWLTSPDGIGFTTFTSVATPLDVSMTTVDIVAGTYAPQIAPGTATYDNFNSP